MIAPIGTPDDQRSLSWLCSMAALGCEASQLPEWAVQLRAQATLLLQAADVAEGRNPMRPSRSDGA